MQTPAFERALDELMNAASKQTTTTMCAEAVEWRCHRSLVADALTVRGIEVAHIQNAGRAKPHRMTPFAEVSGTSIVYRKEGDDRPPG